MILPLVGFLAIVPLQPNPLKYRLLQKWIPEEINTNGLERLKHRLNLT